MKVAFSLKSTKSFENRILIDFLPKFILELLLYAGGSHFILFNVPFVPLFASRFGVFLSASFFDYAFPYG